MGRNEAGQPARSKPPAAATSPESRGRKVDTVAASLPENGPAAIDIASAAAKLLPTELLPDDSAAANSNKASVSGGIPLIASSNDENERKLIDRIIAGDRSALAELFTLYQPRLWRLVSFRLHPKLRGRIDPDDVLQDAWMRAVERVDYFLRDASQSCFIWFRIIVSQTLIDLHRFHIGASKRNAAREMSMTGRWNSESTSTSLAAHLQGRLTSPSAALARVETAQQVDAVLQGMDELDREVLALRHFEGLTNHETALVLEMTEQAASARYVRALRRLKQILTVSPSLFGEWKPRE